MSIRFTLKPEEANAITHAGNFHADDIFGMIVLEKLLGDLVVFRTQTSMPEKERYNPNAIIFDIGYGKFDHHQKGGNGFHPSKNSTLKPIPYASVGLLWKAFGMTICNKLTNRNIKLASKIWTSMEEQLIIGIDAIDNGIYPQLDGFTSKRIMTVSNIISIMNPVYAEDDDYSISLKNAITFAKLIFDVCLYKILNEATNMDFSYNIKNTKKFYPEQIFACSLLKRIYPNVDFEVENIEYDYPQLPNEFQSSDDIPVSIFGKVWEIEGKKYSNSILEDEDYPDYIWDFVKNYLVLGIDASANGFIPHNNPKFVEYKIFTTYDFINALNPVQYSEEAYDKSKEVALQVADMILDRVFTEAIDHLTSRKYVEEKIIESTLPNCKKELTHSSKHILVFDRHVHWKDWVAKSYLAKNIWFVISPSNKGGYVVQPVPCKYNQNGYRKGFPKIWHGLNGKALRKVTHVPTATFVHSMNGFIGGAEDLKGAIMLAEKAFPNTECAKKVISTFY